MSDLKTNLQEILQEKQDKIIPENIKKDIQIFDIIGTYEGSESSGNGVKLFETVEDMNLFQGFDIEDIAIITSYIRKPFNIYYATKGKPKDSFTLKEKTLIGYKVSSGTGLFATTLTIDMTDIEFIINIHRNRPVYDKTIIWTSSDGLTYTLEQQEDYKSNIDFTSYKTNMQTNWITYNLYVLSEALECDIDLAVNVEDFAYQYLPYIVDTNSWIDKTTAKISTVDFSRLKYDSDKNDFELHYNKVLSYDDIKSFVEQLPNLSTTTKDYTIIQDVDNNQWLAIDDMSYNCLVLDEGKWYITCTGTASAMTRTIYTFKDNNLTNTVMTLETPIYFNPNIIRYKVMEITPNMRIFEFQTGTDSDTIDNWHFRIGSLDVVKTKGDAETSICEFATGPQTCASLKLYNICDKAEALCQMTEDSLASNDDIIEGRTAYCKGAKLSGTMSKLATDKEFTVESINDKKENQTIMAEVSLGNGSKMYVNPEMKITGLMNYSDLAATINLTADKIKAGETILGIEGSVVELIGQEKTITPAIQEQIITPDTDYNAITKLTINPVTNSIDSNIVPENIKNGVTILGVTGTYTGE